MKKSTIVFVTLLMFIIILSCHHNRLKTSEKDLAKEILLQEKEKEESEKAALEKESETRNSLSGSLRKREIRSVDPEHPLVRIDMPGTRNIIREFKLSDIASSVRYVKLQTPPDTILLYDPFFYRNSLISSCKADDENIVFQGLFGITRFNMQGEYQETIWKNESGIDIGWQGIGWRPQDFLGVMPNNPVSIFDGNIYYSFTDGFNGTGQFIEYKPETERSLSVGSKTEVHKLGSVKGETLIETQKKPFERFDWVYGIGSDIWVGINQYWNAGKSGSLLVAYNDKGDTLCQFTDFDHIVNFDKPQYRHAVDLASYYYDGLLTIKQEYNDTVFRLIPPNILLPVYLIDFGEFKVSSMDGLNPDFDLSGKFVLNTLHETKDFLIIRYTQNNDSPNNRKKNAVKFYNTFYFKKEGKIFHQPGFTLVPEGLVNDLDGGMSFWPDFITPEGEMMKLVSGKVMKDYINSDAFKGAAISKERRQKLISMASGLKPTDMIIMIVK